MVCVHVQVHEMVGGPHAPQLFQGLVGGFSEQETTSRSLIQAVPR